MLIKIKDIPEVGLDLTAPLGRALLGEALDGMAVDLERSRAEAKLSLTKSEDDTVFLRGAVSGEVLVPCVRCLREVKAPFEAPLKMVFTEGEPAAEGEDEPTDDTEHGTHDGHTLELDQVLREALILAVPMTPMCRATCKGLCAVCGGDKNEKDCGCAVEQNEKLEDPRLAPLKGLKL